MSTISIILGLHSREPVALERSMRPVLPVSSVGRVPARTQSGWQTDSSGRAVEAGPTIQISHGG